MALHRKIVMEKQFKDCKWVLKPFVLEKGETEAKLLKHPLIFYNPNAIDLIEKHWDKRMLRQLKGNWYKLCENPNAVRLIKKHWDVVKDKISWRSLYKNPNAIDIIDEHWDDKVLKHIKTDLDALHNLFMNSNINILIETHWDWFKDTFDLIGFDYIQVLKTLYMNNPFIMELIERHWDWFHNRLYWHELCRNSNAMPFLEKQWDQLIAENKIHWPYLCKNSNAIHKIDAYWNSIIADNNENDNEIVRKLVKTLEFNSLIINPNAGPLLDKHWDWLVSHNLIDIDFLLSEMPDISFIERHWDWLISNNQLDWNALCDNVHALPLILKHWDDAVNGANHIWETLVYNPDIFMDEYREVAIKWFRSFVTEELMARIWHPSNIHRFASLGMGVDD